MAFVFVPLAIALVIFGLTENLLNSIFTLFSNRKSGASPHAHNVIEACIHMVVFTVTCFINIFLRVLTFVSSKLVQLLVVMCVLTILYVTYEQYPNIWVGATDFYNARVGPLVGTYLVVPLRVVSIVYRAVTPLINGFIWVGKVTLTQGLLPILWNQLDAVQAFALAFLRLCASSAVSTANYLRNADCVDLACLQQGAQTTLDLITPMGHIKTMTAVVLQVSRNVCSPIGGLAELVLYPLQDLQIAQAFHHGANALLHMWIQVPITTMKRCAAYGSLGSAFDLMMCTPDMQPIFAHATATLRALGVGLDNWLSLAYSMAVAIAERRAWWECTLPIAVTAQAFRSGDLLTGATATIGLTTYLTASSNNSMAYFYGGGIASGTAVVAVWPEPIDVSMGLAVVIVDDTGTADVSRLSAGTGPGSRQPTALLGCRCEDTTAGIRIRCSTLVYPSGGGSFDVWFQDDTWSPYMTCQGVEVSVRSVRWPAQRYEGTTTTFGGTPTQLPQPTDCISRGTCTQVDSTIWLVPRCNSPDTPEAMCSNAAVGTNCFPFCMAARPAGSGATSPVLVNANAWRTGKQLLQVDCALSGITGTSTSSAQFQSPGGAITSNLGLTSFSGITSKPLSVSTQSLACKPGPNAMSWIKKNLTSSTEQFVPFILETGQPFAVTGDTVLIASPQADGNTLVMVERLFGDQTNTFTLQRMWNDLPAAPQQIVEARLLTYSPSDSLSVPLDYRTSRVMATSSRNYVFYAVNPALQLFSAYLNYCKDRTALPQFQFMIYSSYGPLRVYRVRAYCQTQCTQLSSQITFSGFSDGTFNDATFNCSRHYNASITELEYVDEQNLAVTVQVADTTFDVSTLSGPGSRYVTYWLNPDTMAIRTDRRWPLPTSPSTAAAQCATLVQLPKVATLLASLANANVAVLETISGGLLYTRGLVDIWKQGGVCALQTRRHSVLSSCGQGVYSFDDFFDHLDDASATFWGVLTFIEEGLSDNNKASVVYHPLQNLMAGMVRYARATVSITSIKGVQDIFDTPVAQEAKALFSILKTGSISTTSERYAIAGMRWARYGSKVLVHAGVDTARALVQADEMDAMALWRIFIGSLYDHQTDFYTIVTTRSQEACIGLEVMFGGGNPWGALIESTCQAGAQLPTGLYKLVMTFFVDAPMVRCVCKESAGQNMRAFAIQNCVPNTPLTLRPLLMAIIQESSPELLCSNVIAHTKKQLTGSLDPWFETLYKGLDALGSSVDFALVGFDSDAGQCLNFQQDPNVVVLVPYPVDYFQGCARTSACHRKCPSEWDALQTALQSYGTATTSGSTTLSTQVQSLFFPDATPDMVLPGQLLAMAQPTTSRCNLLCRSSTDLCVAIAILLGDYIQVRHYCIPAVPSQSTYSVQNATYDWETNLGATALQVNFWDTEGDTLLALCTIPNGTAIFLASRADTSPLTVLQVKTDSFASTVQEARAFPVPIQLLYFSGCRPIRITGFVAVGGYLLADVAVRAVGADGFVAAQKTLWIDPYDIPHSAQVEMPSTDIWRNYQVVRLDTSSATSRTLLLWPALAGQKAHRLTIMRPNDESAPTILPPEPFQTGTSLAQQAALSGQSLLLAVNANIDPYTNEYVIYGSNGDSYDWLYQLRLRTQGITLSAATTSNSQPVTATVTVITQCDGIDCRSCPTLQLRAICSAYQSCSLMRCIGTPVNQRRPLCGVGQLLRTSGAVSLQTTQGAWNIFTDTFMILLKLTSDRSSKSIQVTWPDENFFGYVCEAKDASAEFFSVLTSTINSALQKSQLPVPTLASFTNVDANTNAVLSIATTSVNGFLHQAALFPIYMMVVTRQITMCQLNGMISVVSRTGYTLTLTSSDMASATDAIAGACLSMYDVTQSQQTSTAPGELRLSGVAQTALTVAAQRQAIARIEPMVHVADGMLAYAAGLMASFGNVLQSFDLRHCLLPDATLYTMAQCACGDDPVSISAVRAQEGAAQHAFWCTGTLAMLNTRNQIQLVYNPYTYAQLRDKVRATMDPYLRCASDTFNCVPPQDPIFSTQGVSLLAVLTECRQNYVNKQWDSGAYAMYSKSALKTMITGNVQPTPMSPTDGPGQCLLDASNNGALNSDCLAQYSRTQGWNDQYWAFDPITSTNSADIDACVVFSGPASNINAGTERQKKFKDCLMGYGTPDTCDLSGFAWTPASSNNVPVAARHVIHTNGTEASQGSTAVSANDAIQSLYTQARQMVLDAVMQIGTYDNSELRVGFFSAEGDVIHQLLDCVFLGPYARMDYWPLMRCNESDTDDCLVGPYWARDEGGGDTRNIDITTCEPSTTLPFTCGSPSRKAVIKHFVQNKILRGKQGADIVIEQVQGWLQGVTQLWQDQSHYGCDCPSGGNSPACCQAYQDDIPNQVPRSLRTQPMVLNTTSVMNTMQALLAAYYTEAKSYNTPWDLFLDDTEKAKYDWPGSQGAHWVHVDARYDTTQPTMMYNATEAMSPPQSPSDPTLWHTCHGAIRQVLFTMPVDPGTGKLRDPSVMTLASGDVTAIAAQITELVKTAFEASPLFRHYNPRHHPSNSTLCRRYTTTQPSTQGTVNFSSFVMGDITMVQGKDILPIPRLGAYNHLLGDRNSSCFCGWAKVDGWCVVPSVISGQVPVPLAPNNSFPYSTQDRRLFESAYTPDWPCPEMELSEHLGFMDPAATEAWLIDATQVTTSGEFLLRSGAGGLKVGNAPGLSNLNTSTHLGATMNTRHTPSKRVTEPSQAILELCAEPKLNHSLLDEFVEHLFPMAQGVSESPTVSYCLRYYIELARLRTLELMLDRLTSTGGAWDATLMDKQKQTTLTWKRRCGTQAQVISLCTALDMYKPNPIYQPPCLQSWDIIKDGSATVYVTPDCLVNIGGVFYDPCLCLPALCQNGSAYQYVQQAQIQQAACRLPMDPRAFVTPSEMGWWGQDDAAGQDWNEWLQDPSNLLDLDAFGRRTVDTPAATGNTADGTHWGTAEGYMNESARFCDMISDYWPDDAAFPIGYHPTIPCHHSDAGYRSFDNVFAYELQQGQHPTMVYSTDQTREASKVDSHFGASGLCRATNFGYPMYETNTMRVCTKVASNDDVDVHVPSRGTPNGQWQPVQCSSSSADLPWADHTYHQAYDSTLHSVGTVPSMPGVSDTIYPASDQGYWQVGPLQRMRGRTAWGEGCADFSPPPCQTSLDCADGFHCTAGVCVQDSVQCIKHSDCPDTSMCTGVGTCVQPTIMVLNRLGEDAEFRAHSTTCPAHTYSMRGASPWGNVPDLLQGHGMCKYMHWAEYLTTMSTCACLSNDGTTCVIDAGTCNYYNFNLDKVEFQFWVPGQSAPKKFRMLPTTCDRDYERMSIGGTELRVCAPQDGEFTIVDPIKNTISTASYATLFKTYDENDRTVPMRVMPYKTSQSYGFLGATTKTQFESCGTIPQCYPDTFTEDGTVKMSNLHGYLQANRTTITGQPYDPQDTFRCGFIGYFASDECHLDTKLFPLYRLLCMSLTTTCSVAGVLDTNALMSACTSIQQTYQPSIQIIHDVNVANLARLFQVFQRPTTLAGHVNTVECMKSIFTAMQAAPFTSTSLYFPFDFTSYEFPFAWFYQCMVHQHINPSIDTAQIYPCFTYDKWGTKQNAITPYAPVSVQDNFETYVSNVRGGYTAANVAAFTQSALQNATDVWDTCAATVATDLFNGPDISYPMCDKQIRWKLPTLTNTESLFIMSVISQTCAASTSVKSLQLLKTEWGLSTVPTRTQAIARLTTAVGAKSCQTQNCGTDSLLTLIKSMGQDILLSQSLISQLLTQPVGAQQGSFPIRFNSTMPTIEDAAWQGLFNTLGTDYIPATDNTDQDTGVCPELTKDLFQHTPQEQDPNIKSGGTQPVKVCPVHSTGNLNCAYPSITVGGVTYQYNQTDVANSNNRQALYNYFRAIHTKMMTCYTTAIQQAAQSPLPPAPLPWFEREAFLNFTYPFKFNLQNISKYMHNINPHTDSQIMCSVATPTNDYTQCTDPNYLALQDHVQKQYTKRGPPIIPNNNQLSWPVTRAFMAGGAIFSYASTRRNLKHQYLASITDSASTCMAQNITIQNQVCNITTIGASSTQKVVNPWLGGYWNPWATAQAGCDVNEEDILNGYTEVIDVQCQLPDYCSPISTSKPFYNNMPDFATCNSAQNTKPVRVDVDDSTSYNLCKIQPQEDSICVHDQGMVGGTDGMPVEESTGTRHMFTLTDFTQFPSGADNGYLDNPLFAGGSADYGFLRIPSTHIGGTHIGMTITQGAAGTPGEMKVTKVPLNPSSIPASAQFTESGSKNVDEWVSGLREAWTADHNSYLTRNPTPPPTLTWDCPLKRRSFYSGSIDGFAPHLPNGLRSTKLFGNITGNKYAHPTQQTADGAQYLGGYYTTNGFCFCPETQGVPKDSCGVQVSDITHPCSLFHTIQVLQGKTWGTSYTFQPTTPDSQSISCTIQLDWPNVGGPLRDGDTLPHTQPSDDIWKATSDRESRQCHVLDRMRPFAYSYMAASDWVTTSETTLSPHGVCHTGTVAASVPKPSTANRCVRHNTGLPSERILCDDGTVLPVKRLASTPPSTGTDTARKYRRQCNACSPVPRFKTPAGADMPQESSFGVPFRRSTERVLAADLKQALCQQDPQCLQSLNQSAWKPGAFLRAYLTNPNTLFMPFNQSAENTERLWPSTQMTRKSMPDDSALWARPWAYCGSRDALAGRTPCNGSIPKQDWRKDKVGTCYASVQNALKGGPDPMATTSVCNLDKSLTGLCKTIVEARKMIAQANCIASGAPECAIQEHVYTPGTWEVSNREFVHTTIRAFYTQIDGCDIHPERPCICPTEVNYSAIASHNAQLLRECPAVPVFALQGVIQGLRAVTTSIAQGVASVVGMAVNLLSMMLSTTNADEFKAQALIEWASLKRTFSGIMGTGADLVSDLVLFKGTLGPFVATFLQSACAFLNYSVQFIRDTWCKLTINWIPAFLNALKDAITWIDSGFKIVDDVFFVILKGYLPEAFLTLQNWGYTKLFQASLFDQKKQTYADKKQPKLNQNNPNQGAPLTGAQRTSANSAADKKTLTNLAGSSTLKTIGRATAGLGAVGAIVSTAFDIIKLVDDLQKAQAIEAAMQNFPDSFTDFDFSPVQHAMDDLGDFLARDLTCYSDYTVSGFNFLCTLATLPQLNTSGIIAMAPYPSQCWAEAQQNQLGVTTLYACTGSSTCMLSPTSDQTALCGQCPGAATGYQQFGCNTILQKCACGTSVITPSQCLANSDCGPDTECSLLTGLDDISFGAMSCGTCAAEPVCLRQGATLKGQCTCLQSARSELDLCATAVGQITHPQPSRLCAYSKDPGNYFFWGEISLIICANAQTTACVEVIADDSGTFYMSLATAVLQMQLSFSGRRLLTENAPPHISVPNPFLHETPYELLSPSALHTLLTAEEWNHTAPVCANLAHAYKQGERMGPTDEAAAQSCAYWRHVGRQIVRDYGLASLQQADTFLVSIDDFAAALGQKGVADELMRRPEALAAAAMYSPMLKPMRAFWRAIKIPAISTRILDPWTHRRTHHRFTHAPRHSFRPAKLGPNSTSNTSALHTRRLLQQDFLAFDDTQLVQAVEQAISEIHLPSTPDIQVNPYFIPYIDKQNSEYTWPVPPPDSADTCPPVTVMVQASKQTLLAIKNYFEHFAEVTKRTKTDNSLGSVLPSFLTATPNTTAWFTKSPRPTSTTYTDIVFDWILHAAGTDRDQIQSFFTDPCEGTTCAETNRLTAMYILETLVRCDFENVMFCKQERRALAPTLVFVALLYVIVSILGSYAGVPVLSQVIFVLLTPSFLMWYVYTVPPTCFPLVPTCLMDDLTDLALTLLPAHIEIPRALQCPGDARCLRSCSALGFTSWEDPAIQVICDLGGCDLLAANVPVFYADKARAAQAAYADADTTTARRVCAAVTSIFALPLILVLFILLALIPSILYFFMQLLAPLCTLLWRALSYNHSKEE